MTNSPAQPTKQPAAKTASKKPAVKADVKEVTQDKVVVKTVPPVAKRPVKARSSKPATTVVAPAAIEEKPVKAAKEKKAATKRPKLVRDSFTFPATDYALIGALKQRALRAGREIKKSELLRAGLAVLSALSDAQMLKTLDGLDKLKTGRPAK
ncbi:MAG: hypothetical protein J0653_07815 [Deltaproteobacteria bacterium]|nr:hypothetical protein [Deltaproteobacteria bacterium]